MKFEIGRILFTALALVMLLSLTSLAKDRSEVLRYEVTWNGSKAGHGDITMKSEDGKVSVLAQAVSDGALKTILEIWSQIRATFSTRNFLPESYRFHLKSNLLRSEVVDLSFDHKKQTVLVNKNKGGELESHSEKVSGLRDPISAVYLLRNQKDFDKPMFVDIYDGKDKARLHVYPDGAELVKVKAGTQYALRMNLRLEQIGREPKEIARGKLWISNDENRIPLLLTASPIVGNIRFELVHAQM
ncbi:MAG: DUF3108 domain-containing protein [Pseudomonadota bacterium]